MILFKRVLFYDCEILYNKNNNDRYSKIYSEKGFELMQKTKTITETNELDDKEKENYREYDYFINILEELPEPSKLKDHYKKTIIIVAYFTTAPQNVLL